MRFWSAIVPCLLLTAHCLPSLPRLVPQYVWLYVLLWFLAQDVVKVLAYWFMATYFAEDTRGDDVRLISGKTQAMIDAENRQLRLRGGAVPTSHRIVLAVAFSPVFPLLEYRPCFLYFPGLPCLSNHCVLVRGTAVGFTMLAYPLRAAPPHHRDPLAVQLVTGKCPV